MALPKELKFVFSVNSSSVSFRNDVRLDTPSLTSPADGARECGDTVTLQWSAVTGATYYIVQWSRNSSFSGPSFNGKKVNTNSIVLNVGNDASDDITPGGTWYWRVMAYDGNGGVSDKSEVRSFKVGCSGNVHNSTGGSETAVDECFEYIDLFELKSNSKLDTFQPGDYIEIRAKLKYHTVSFVGAEWNESDLASNQYVTVMPPVYTDKDKLLLRMRANRGDCNGGNAVITLNVTFTDGASNFTCQKSLVVRIMACDEYDQLVVCNNLTGTNVSGCEDECEWTKYVVGAFLNEEVTFTEGGYDYTFYKKRPVVPLPFTFYDGDLPGDDVTEFKNYAIGYMKVFDCPASGKVLRPVIFLGDIGGGGGGGGLVIEDHKDMDNVNNQYTLWVEFDEYNNYTYYYGMTFAIYMPWES